MAKIIANNYPAAWIVSPKDRGRKSIKNGKVFLENGDEFEIELFNPLTVSVLADIKLNGNHISKSGLIIRPGQRVYLDCFIDDRKKFIFNTYQIDGSEESLNATKNNGLLEVFFYKEEVVTMENWKEKFNIIIEKWYPVYPPTYPLYPVYPTYPIWYSTTGGVQGNIYNLSNSCSSYSCDNNITYTSSSYNLSNISSGNIETGRVEKGGKSSQKFEEVDMNFKSYYISSTVIQILPKSRKPIEIKEIKKSKNNDVTDLIKKLGDLHKEGILTDEEFNIKKQELLSRI